MQLCLQVAAKPPGNDWHFLCDPLKFRRSLHGPQIKEEEIDQNICEAEAFIIQR